MSWKDKLRKAFSARDERALDEAIGEAEAAQEPGVEIHNHIPAPDNLGVLPPEPSERGGEDRHRNDDRRRSDDNETPPWFKAEKEANDAWRKKVGDDIAALQKWAGQEAQEPEHQEDRRNDDRRRDDDAVYNGSEVHSSDPISHEPNLEMHEGRDRRNDDRRQDDRRRSDDRRDEANKKILGELEYEAPPGTGDAARRARDSAYLGDSFQDTASKAEILAPGIRIPMYDRAAAPVRTFRAIDSLRRSALDLANSRPEGRGVIEACLGRPLNTRAMDASAVRLLFNATAASLAGDNHRRSTDSSALRPVDGGGLPVGRIRTLADINANNAKRFRRSA